MMRLKGCWRCGGDLYLQADLDGPFWLCLQCGRAVEARLLGAPALAPVAVGVGPGAVGVGPGADGRRQTP